MEIIETVLGLAMMYAWVHSAVIIFKKTKNTTGYEQGILIVGFIGLVLTLIGSM